MVPTKDAPELAYIIESSDDKYVPDVFFKEMDKYKNEIKKVSLILFMCLQITGLY